MKENINQKSIVIDVDSLRMWTQQVLMYHGYSSDNAKIIADHLVDSDMCGVESHGIMRLSIYLERVSKKLVNPSKIPKIKSKNNVLFVDGGDANGQIVATYATKRLLELSKKKRGISCALIKNSTHFGRAGHYAQMLAEQGNIACVMTNAESCVAPYGSNEPLLGTNPIAFAAPSKFFPIIVDISTSIVTFGDVFLNRDKGTQIPTDWGFDANGNITDDPNVLTCLRPMSKHKGFALGLFIDILSGVLTNADFGTRIGNMYKDFTKPQNVGHFMWSLPIECVMPISKYQARIETLLQMVYDSRPEMPDAKIQIPGENAYRLFQQRKKNGISISKHVWNDLIAISKDTAINVLTCKRI